MYVKNILIKKKIKKCCDLMVNYYLANQNLLPT